LSVRDVALASARDWAHCLRRAGRRNGLRRLNLPEHLPLTLTEQLETLLARLCRSSGGGRMWWR